MVKHTVRWSAQAKADPKDIFEYVKNVESKERASYVMVGIRQTANDINLFPAKHSKEPVILDGSVRYAVKWRYKILYTVTDKHINIARIFHTAQSPAKLNPYPV